MRYKNVASKQTFLKKRRWLDHVSLRFIPHLLFDLKDGQTEYKDQSIDGEMGGGVTWCLKNASFQLQIQHACSPHSRTEFIKAF